MNWKAQGGLLEWLCLRHRGILRISSSLCVCVGLVLSKGSGQLDYGRGSIIVLAS